MAIVLESPKLLSIRITKLLPKAMKNNFVYTYDATLDVTAQLHSGTTGHTPAQYDGHDVSVGDYVATTSQGRILKIYDIKSAGPTRIECILIDEDQVNAATDSTQYGESAIDTDDGILFELREGKPYLFPLPDVLPGGLTEEFAIQIATRFNFVGKEKNINVEQLPHTFEVGETVTLSANGWASDTTEPTGVVVKADDDSFSVRLFGTKTYMELPGNVGDIYFWDPIDRILTTNPTAPGSVKLFQKLGSKEALLLDGNGASSTTTGGGDFSGNYNDLFNTPVIPTDVSQLSDSSGLLQHITKTSDLTNDSNFVTQAYVDSQIANVTGGGDVDLSGYATTVDLTSAIDALTAVDSANLAAAQAYADSIAFSGDYNDLTNAPTIPDVTGLASTAYVDQQIANIGDHFSGDYNDLINKPTIPDVTGLASTAYVDQQITGINTFSGNYNDLTNKPTLFSGNYNELYNIPAIPTSTSDLINDSGFITGITSGQILSALGYTPQNQATAFSGDYNSLINKPTIPTVPTNVSAFTNDSGYITAADIPDTSSFLTETEIDSKIAGAVTGGTVDLSSYVTTTNLTTALSDYVTTSDLTTTLASYQPSVDLTAYYTKTEVDALITPHFSGSYNDLTDTPTIPDLTGYATQTYVDTAIGNVNGGGGNVDLTGYATETYVNQQISAASLGGVANINDLNDVAIDGLETDTHALMYNALSGMWENKDLNDSWASKDYVTAQLAAYATGGTIDLEGYATESWVDQRLLERGEHFSGNYNDLVNRPQLFSGSYNDLTNKPTLKSYTLTSNSTSFSLVETTANPDQVVATIDFSSLGVGFSGDYNDLTNKPILFSGNYNDLANKPYIPSIAGLATETYVNNLHNEPAITGDRYFTGDVEFQQTTKIITSTVDTVAEHKNLVMALQTNDDTETEAVFSDGSRIVIDANSTAMFEVYIVGATASDQYGVKIKGIINNTLGTVTMIGAPSRETLSQTDPAWTADVSADDTNNSLKVTVVGSAGISVDWTVFCQINQVKR